jgi:hypothetical protein
VIESKAPRHYVEELTDVLGGRFQGLLEIGYLYRVQRTEFRPSGSYRSRIAQ